MPRLASILWIALLARESNEAKIARLKREQLIASLV